jgi:hypothetical protein
MNLSDLPTTVFGLKKGHKRSCKRSGTLNGQERLGTNSGKRSHSRFKNERMLKLFLEKA